MKDSRHSSSAAMLVQHTSDIKVDGDQRETTDGCKSQVNTVNPPRKQKQQQQLADFQVTQAKDRGDTQITEKVG